MIRQTHNLVLKDTSESEMARFRQFMLHVVRMQVEEGKAAAEWNQFIASEYGSAPENNQPKLSTSEVISKPKVSVPTKSQLKAKTKVAVKKQANLKPINQRGFVIAENGIRLHATPSPYDEAYTSKKGIFGKIYKVVSEVVVMHEDLNNKGWYKIRTYDKKEGYIEKQHINIIPHNNYLDKYTRTFLYIKSGYNFETHIANIFYKNYKIETGNDRRTLAEAFYLLNTQSKHNHGIIIKKDVVKAGKTLELGIKAAHDPSFHKARLTYSQLQLSSNHIVRIPNEQYILLQRQKGSLSSRPEFMNTAIKAGDVLAEIIEGVGGLIVGIIEGILRGIYDTLVGIIEYIESIIDTIRDLLSGKFFDKLKEMYQAIIKLANSDWSELKNMLYSFLGGIGDNVKKVINNWHTASSYEKGRVVGLLLGTILLEVIVGIFTGGGAAFAKLAAKLGKLGKILMKIEKFTHEIKDKLKAKLPKKLFEKGEYTHDPDDSKNWMRSGLLIQAKSTAEIMDTKGNTIGELIAAVKLSGKIYPKLKPKWDSIHKKNNIYAITLTASPTKTVDANFTSGEKINKEQTNLSKDEINKIQKVKGKYPINALDFAGRTFDFNLDKNPRMKMIMEKRWEARKLSTIDIKNEKEKIKKLFKNYPKGVKFTEKGFPDFSNYALKLSDGKLIKIKVGLNGTDKDILEAKKLYKKAFGKDAPSNHTFHHIENTNEVVLVPSDLHSFVRHTGGNATGKN